MSSTKGEHQMVPLSVLLKRELANEKIENPNIFHGQANHSKKGEDFTLVKTECQRMLGDDVTTYHVFGITYTSDYFQDLYDLAMELIRKVHAYVNHQENSGQPMKQSIKPCYSKLLNKEQRKRFDKETKRVAARNANCHDNEYVVPRTGEVEELHHSISFLVALGLPRYSFPGAAG